MRFDRDFELMMLCAARYCIGRRTYIVKTYVDYVEPKISMFSDWFLDLILSEINVNDRGDNLGDDCDKVQWHLLKNSIEKELEKRHE